MALAHRTRVEEVQRKEGHDDDHNTTGDGRIRRAALSLALLWSIAASGGEAQAQGDNCRMSTVTGYSVEQYPGRTADGSSTGGSMAAGDYLAAGPRWMLGQRIRVATERGEMVYRIADTGHLAEHGIDYDLLFWTTREALEWGRRRVMVCVE